jgi:hypothetical protein
MMGLSDMNLILGLYIYAAEAKSSGCLSKMSRCRFGSSELS